VAGEMAEMLGKALDEPTKVTNWNHCGFVPQQHARNFVTKPTKTGGSAPYGIW
jgi:hypothetical protein